MALAPVALLAVWARFDSPAPWESGVLAALALGDDPWGEVVRVVNTIGDSAPWLIVVGIVAAVVGLLRGPTAALLVALSYVADLVAFGVKLVVERVRPETLATEHFFGPDSFSFPSGHVVRAVALAAVVAWLLAPPRVRGQLAVGAAGVAWLVMGYARVSLGVHWPTDTLGGALLGLGWFALTAWLIR